LDGAHLPLDGQDLGERGLNVVEERHPRLGVEVLADVADRQRRGADDLAAVGLLLAQQELEERRLPRAVAAHEPDFFTGVVLPRDALQDVVRAVRLLDVVEAVEHAGRIERAGYRRPSTTKSSGLRERV